MFSVMAALQLAWANEAEALQFFQAHRAKGDAFDPSLAAHYADDAVVSTLRDGGPDALRLTGAQWKAVVRDAMALAKARNDKSTYTDVSVAPHGDGYRITAVHTSSVKCAPGAYRLDIVPQGDGWTIVEEHTETSSLPQCPPSKKLARAMTTVHDGLQPHLPLELDADTRLERVEMRHSALVYTQRLHRVAKEELELEATVAALHQLGRAYACDPPEMRALVDQGATIRYEYLDKAGSILTRVDTSAGLCP